jgi:hypothetical protein
LSKPITLLNYKKLNKIMGLFFLSGEGKAEISREAREDEGSNA